MTALEKFNSSFLLGAITFSLLLHLGLAISIMNIEIPKVGTNRANFEAWVKDIAPKKPQGIILPKMPKSIANPEPVEKAEKIDNIENNAPVAESGPIKKSTKTKSQGTSTGSSGVPSVAPRKVASAGVLGIIGVASDSNPKRGGSRSAVADVFSSNSGSVSDDLGAVMEGKKSSQVASAENINRKNLRGSDGGVATTHGPADIGSVGAASSGKVTTGQRQEADIPVPKVSSVGGGITSGTADQNSVVAIIARKNSSFTRCYERSLKNNPDLAGKLAYQISVSEEGEVLDVKFVEDTLRTREVSDCIKSILLRLVFPKPKGGPAIFSSVLVFGTT